MARPHKRRMTDEFSHSTIETSPPESNHMVKQEFPMDTLSIVLQFIPCMQSIGNMRLMCRDANDQISNFYLSRDASRHIIWKNNNNTDNDIMKLPRFVIRSMETYGIVIKIDNAAEPDLSSLSHLSSPYIYHQIISTLSENCRSIPSLCVYHSTRICISKCAIRDNQRFTQKDMENTCGLLLKKGCFNTSLHIRAEHGEGKPQNDIFYTYFSRMATIATGMRMNLFLYQDNVADLTFTGKVGIDAWVSRMIIATAYPTWSSSVIDEFCARTSKCPNLHIYFILSKQRRLVSSVLLPFMTPLVLRRLYHSSCNTRGERSKNLSLIIPSSCAEETYLRYYKRPDCPLRVGDGHISWRYGAILSYQPNPNKYRSINLGPTHHSIPLDDWTSEIWSGLEYIVTDEPESIIKMVEEGAM